MTTLIGIQTNSVLESIIIVADRQVTIEEEGRVSKRPVKKIYTGESWIMGDAGADDSEIAEFYRSLKNDEERTMRMIEGALEKRRFMEVDTLNARVTASEGRTIDDAHCFLLAINKPHLGLWIVDELGNLKAPPKENEIPYVCLGSGSKKVKEHMEYLLGEEEIDVEKMTTRQGMIIAESCFSAAEKRDLYTGLGLDMYVIYKTEIRETSKKIKRAMLEAKKREFEEACGFFDKLEEDLIKGINCTVT